MAIRPERQSTVGDVTGIFERLKKLEATKARVGCGLPCPPWTVDYDTGEVVGTTYEAAGLHPPPLTLEATGTGFDTSPDGLLHVVIDAEADTHVGTHVEINAAGVGATLDGNVTAITTGGSGTISGDMITITAEDSATVDGSFVTVAAGDSATVTGVRAFATGGDSANVYGGYFDATGGDFETTAIYARAHGPGTLLAAELHGDVKITGDVVGSLFVKLDGGQFQVRDSLGNPVFEVRNDGTVHILTGGSVIADL